MENSESRTAPSPEAASDDFASPCNPRPGPAYWAGVVDGLRRAGVAVPPDIAARAGTPPGEPRDRLAFEPVPLRYREDGLTPEKQREYVEALADCGVAREAAARVGLTEQSINRVRRRSDARSFDRACEAAHIFGARQLRSIAYQRAVEGTLKGHYYHGERVSEERVHDNRLLIYLLGKTEHLLAPPPEARAICDHWEPCMDALEQGLEPPDLGRLAAEARPEPARPEFTGYELVEDEDGSWWTRFPPPEGFDGEEQGEYGDYGYKRRLSPREQEVLDADLDREFDDERAAQCDRRDRFFGFAGDEISCSMEAEPYEPIEPSGDGAPGEGPMEYKSLVPPCPTGGLPLFENSARQMLPKVRWRKSRIATSTAAELSPQSRFKKRPALRPHHIQIPPPRHPC